MYDIRQHAVLITGSPFGDFYAIRLDGRVWVFEEQDYEEHIAAGSDTDDDLWYELTAEYGGSWMKRANDGIDRHELEQAFVADNHLEVLAGGAL